MQIYQSDIYESVLFRQEIYQKRHWKSALREGKKKKISEYRLNSVQNVRVNVCSERSEYNEMKRSTREGVISIFANFHVAHFAHLSRDMALYKIFSPVDLTPHILENRHMKFRNSIT